MVEATARAAISSLSAGCEAPPVADAGDTGGGFLLRLRLRRCRCFPAKATSAVLSRKLFRSQVGFFLVPQPLQTCLMLALGIWHLGHDHTNGNHGSDMRPPEQARRNRSAVSPSLVQIARHASGKRIKSSQAGASFVAVRGLW